jgi:hypothetical protein
MPQTNYFDETSDEDRLQVMVVGTNPPGFMDWTDAQQFISYEKVMWWHDYLAMLVQQGQVTHAWNGRDFCDIEGFSGVTENATVVYSVADLAEFGDLYSLDPLRLKGDFWSIVLQPIFRQRQLDEQRLAQARARYSG